MRSEAERGPREMANDRRGASSAAHGEEIPRVDVVVVTYASERSIGDCLDALQDAMSAGLTVVDNASPDGTVAVVETRSVPVLRQARNLGFASACNIGASVGRSPYILFLNPDAVLDNGSLDRLIEVLDTDASVGIVAPRFLYPNGRTASYLRRFPTVVSSLAQALFLDRVIPSCSEIVTDEAAYDRVGNPDWIPGACLIIRRSLFEQLGGFDERFFMFCEDKDLCRRAWDSGLTVCYVPSATCVHEGSGSSPRGVLLPVLAESRLRYAAKHFSPRARMLYRLTLVLEATIRLVFSRGGRTVRAGHLRALAHVVIAADPRRAVRT